MKKITLITLALFTLLFSQCKKENIDNNNNIDTKKVKVRCEIPMGNGDKSDFTDLMTDGSINWSIGTERIYLAVHHKNASKRQIIELVAETTVSATTLAFEGEVPEDILINNGEYEVWYFGNSQNLQNNPYLEIEKSGDIISSIGGNISTQSGNLEDLGYHHIAKATVIAIEETDGSFSLPLNGTLENQIAIAYVNLERDNSAVVNNLKGSAIVGTEFTFDYNLIEDKYELKVVAIQNIADQTITISGTDNTPSESFIVLFPNANSDVDLIADDQLLYTFKNPITANSLYYRYISDAEIGTLPWDDYGYKFVDLGLESGLKWAMYNIGANQFLDYGDYYMWGAIKDDAIAYNQGTDDISGTVYDVAKASWKGKWRMPKQEEMQELIDNCEFTYETHDNIMCMKAVSNFNGDFVYFPLAGMNMLSGPFNQGVSGYYWSSTPNSNNITEAWGMGCGNGNPTMSDAHERGFGYSVRAVAE